MKKNLQTLNIQSPNAQNQNTQTPKASDDVVNQTIPELRYVKIGKTGGGGGEKKQLRWLNS
ncbi:MAG: hypothetical protein LBG58_11180 [Planctomycetaceae bacterium]|jgi:hypothetical protein|nr:hypothetical protein [Planctomycetaceae bacterium]